MQGIKLGYEDNEKLHRQLKIKGDNEMVNYKEVLSFIQPNFELDDPVRSVWVMRKVEKHTNELASLGSSHSSFSLSPSRLSIRSMNNPMQMTFNKIDRQYIAPS